jgi:parvulin-like peptidyl-prolyl isomerase
MARSGHDFAKLANTYSEDPGSNTKGGLYENIGRGDMVKPFDLAAFNLPVGQISDIVETSYGYHIIKVIERKKEERPLPEVKDELIREILEQKQGNVLFITLNYLKKECGYQEYFDMLEK